MDRGSLEPKLVVVLVVVASLLAFGFIVTALIGGVDSRDDNVGLNPVNCDAICLSESVTDEPNDKGCDCGG